MSRPSDPPGLITDDGEVRRLIGADDLRLVEARIGARVTASPDRHRGRRDDVAVRHDVALGVVDDTEPTPELEEDCTPIVTTAGETAEATACQSGLSSLEVTGVTVVAPLGGRRHRTERAAERVCMRAQEAEDRRGQDHRDDQGEPARPALRLFWDQDRVEGACCAASGALVQARWALRPPRWGCGIQARGAQASQACAPRKAWASWRLVPRRAPQLPLSR